MTTPPVNTVTYDYVQAWTGQPFYNDWSQFDRSQLSIDSVIQALPHENRYAGNTRYPYSTAQHCLALWRGMKRARQPWQVQGWALIHDFSEYIFGDIPTAWKTDEIRGYEADVLRGFAAMFNLPEEMPAIVKEWDFRILRNEMDRFGNNELPEEKKWWRKIERLEYVADIDLAECTPTWIRNQLRNAIGELQEVAEQQGPKKKE